MKILYIANEFRDVQVAARALRSVSPDLTVLWGYSADRAAFWIRQNPDMAVLIVETQLDGQGSASLKQARGLGLQAPIVVVLPEGVVPPRESLEAGADDYIAKGQSFSRELPVVVTRTIERVRTMSMAPLDLHAAPVADALGGTSASRGRLGKAEASLHQQRHSWTDEPSAAVQRHEELKELVHREHVTRMDLEQKLTYAMAALQNAERRESELTLTLADVTERRAEVQTQFGQEVEKRRNVEEFLARARTAHDDAERRHASAMTIAATTLAERHAQYDAELSQNAATHADLRQRLNDVESALDEAREIAASEAAKVERLTRREAELTSMLTDAAATSHTLERRMADTEAALGAANERLARERLVAVEYATERQAAFQTRLEQELEKRRSAEERLAHAETAREDAETRHAAAATTAAALFAERQAKFDAQLAEAVADRSALAQQAHDLKAALDEAQQILALRAAEAERLTKRETELTSMLADAATRRGILEDRLADIETAFKDAAERAAQARLADLEDAAKRVAGLDEVVRHERTTRALVEQKLAHLEAAWRDAEQQHASALTLAAATAAERQEQFQTELSQAAAAYTDAQRNLDEARRDFQRTLDMVSNEYAEAQAKLVASLSERDARLEEQAARHAAALQTIELDHSQRQGDFQTTLAAREREIEELHKALKATASELADATTRCETLHTNLPDLQRQLDESRLETRRQFHRTPVALARCNRDGALTHFNRAFADLVGYRNPYELRGTDFAKTIFESPDDLSWLIERCLGTHARESVETAWKRKNGERLVLRLSALESAPGVIEIAAENITDLRTLQERLGHAHRMEAVGRLASEIAVTCANLLRDVHQDGRQWLTTVSDNAALRQRGERLLEEVTRAAGFLDQLAAYGDEQASALQNVDLNKVLRDLRPVLKQVAGEGVALDLPKLSSPLHVDVKAERVERVFVNLASYGRERMPFGGRLQFELATVVVNQRFLAQYPSVRPGAHALITVTEARRAARSHRLLQLGNSVSTSDAGAAGPDKPGVDLGALQELIRECGGHLWMTVERAGNMVVKIHLPLRAGDDQAQAPSSDTRSRLGRAAARWFRR